MFLPANQPSLRAVITYYSATANVNQEGDVHINDTLQGFGTVPSSLHQRALSANMGTSLMDLLC